MREDKDIGDPNDVVLRIVAPSLLSIIKLLGNLLSERDNSYVFSIPCSFFILFYNKYSEFCRILPR